VGLLCAAHRGVVDQVQHPRGRQAGAESPLPREVDRQIHPIGEHQHTARPLLNECHGWCGDRLCARAARPEGASRFCPLEGRPDAAASVALGISRVARSHAFQKTRSGRNNALNGAAWTLRRWVAAGALEQAEVEDALYAAALANGLVADDGERQCWATIRSGLGAGLQEAIALDDEAR
jgi:hypothetical protein